MNVLVTENKSVGQLSPFNNSVRVFVDNDMDYGYWVPEHTVFKELSEAQKLSYLAPAGAVELEMEPAAAQRLIDAGCTPYAKRKVA